MRFTALFVLSFILPLYASAETLVYVGTYTQGNSASQGIYVLELDTSSGALSEPVLAAAAVNPSFVAIHPEKELLYAVSEVFSDGPDAGRVIAFSIAEDGTLSKLNERSTGGAGAVMSPSIRPGGASAWPITAGGVVPRFRFGRTVRLATGARSINMSAAAAQTQKGKTNHMPIRSTLIATGRRRSSQTSGKTRFLLYDVDPQAGTMTASAQRLLKMPPGSGPRHFCFHPSFRVAFANLEMTSKVALLDYDYQHRTLAFGSILETIPPSASETGNSTAECLVHPNGKFVYVSNRGHNSIAGFSFNLASGDFRPIGNTPTQGEIPRGFGIDPSGRYLIVGNQKTGNVVSLRIDPYTGTLTPTGHEVKIDAAVNIRFKVH